MGRLRDTTLSNAVNIHSFPACRVQEFQPILARDANTISTIQNSGPRLQRYEEEDGREDPCGRVGTTSAMPGTLEDSGTSSPWKIVTDIVSFPIEDDDSNFKPLLCQRLPEAKSVNLTEHLQ